MNCFFSLKAGAKVQQFFTHVKLFLKYFLKYLHLVVNQVFIYKEKPELNAEIQAFKTGKSFIPLYNIKILGDYCSVFTNSTSKTRLALGGITPPAPDSP